jgi:hypothetical protein
MIDRIERYLFLSKRINNSSQERDQDNILLKSQFADSADDVVARSEYSYSQPTVQYGRTLLKHFLENMDHWKVMCHCHKQQRTRKANANAIYQCVLLSYFKRHSNQLSQGASCQL